MCWAYPTGSCAASPPVGSRLRLTSPAAPLCPRRTPPAAPRPAKRVETTPGISWAGVLGALLGFAPMLAIAIGVLVDPGEASRAIAAVPLLMAAPFVPAAR